MRPATLEAGRRCHRPRLEVDPVEQDLVGRRSRLAGAFSHGGAVASGRGKPHRWPELLSAMLAEQPVPFLTGALSSAQLLHPPGPGALRDVDRPVLRRYQHLTSDHQRPRRGWGVAHQHASTHCTSSAGRSVRILACSATQKPFGGFTPTG